MCREVKEVRIVSKLKRGLNKMCFTLIALGTFMNVFLVLNGIFGMYSEAFWVFLVLTTFFAFFFLCYIGVLYLVKKRSSQYENMFEFEGKCSQDMINLIKKDRIVHEEVMWYLRDSTPRARAQERKRYSEIREKHLRIYFSENLKEYYAFRNLAFEKRDKSIIEKFFELQKSNKHVLYEELKSDERGKAILETWWNEICTEVAEVLA